MQIEIRNRIRHVYNLEEEIKKLKELALELFSNKGKLNRVVIIIE